MKSGVEQEMEKLFPRWRDIRDPDLRRKVAQVWESLIQGKDWAEVASLPWTTGFGESISTRNLEHINAVVECALRLADYAQEVLKVTVDRDVLIAAGLLLDADKLVVPTGKKEARANLFPHGFVSATKAMEAALPENVVHAILAHSKGSNIPPRTVEALILHYSDYVTADIRLRAAGADHIFAAEAPRFAESRR